MKKLNTCGNDAQDEVDLVVVEEVVAVVDAGELNNWKSTEE